MQRVETDTPTIPVCPNCGSASISYVEEYAPTGVVAPDGGEEYRTDSGMRCWDCGARGEEPVYVPEYVPPCEEAPAWLRWLVPALAVGCAAAFIAVVLTK